MKILYYESGDVDLDGPIHMTEAQRKRFIEFFRKLLPGEVEVVEKAEVEREFGDREAKPKRWKPAELDLLLGGVPNAVVAQKLSRSEMSVRMRRGEFPPAFFVWLKKKGYALPSDPAKRKALIGRFLDSEG